MTRTKKFLYSSVATAGLQIVTMIAGFITPRVLLQFYGSEINGLVSSITQFISYFNLVEAGLSGAVIYALYKPLSDNDYKGINGVVSAAKKFYMQAGYVFVSLAICLAVVYPMYIKTSVLAPLNIGLLVLILGVNGALEFFTLAKYRALLTADQKTYIVSVASIVHIMVNTTIIVLLANLKVNIIVLRLVALVSIFLRSFILMIYVNSKYKYLNYNERPNTAALDKRWDALYLQILGAIQVGSPVVIITIMLHDLKLVSVYVIFNMVMVGINGLLSIFISGLAASFGDVIARDEQHTLQNAYTEFEFSYYSLITLIYSIALVTITPFIKLYTQGITDINYDLPVIGYLFVINGLLYNIKTPQGMLVISAGLYKETKWQTAIQGMIVVIGGVILSPFLGIIGVLVSSIVANIYRDIDLLFFIPRNVSQLPVKKTFYRILRMVVCMCIICIPFFFIDIDFHNYSTWCLFVACAGVYGLFIIAISGLILDRASLKNVISRSLAIVGAGK